MSSIQQPSLSFSRIIEDTKRVCKTCYNQLLKYSAIYSIISIIFAVLIAEIETMSGGLNMMLLLCVIVILAPFAIYLNLRIFISIINLIQDALNGQFEKQKDYFSESQKYFWKSLMTILLLVAIFIIPLSIAVGLIASGSSQAIANEALVIVGTIIAIVCIIFYIRLFFALFASILNPEERNSIAYSFKITKGNFAFCLFVIIAIAMATSLINPATYLSNAEPLSISMNLISGLVSMFVFPIGTAAFVALYNAIHTKYEHENFDFIEVEPQPNQDNE